MKDFPLVPASNVISLSDEQLNKIAISANLLPKEKKKFLVFRVKRSIQQLDLANPDVIEAIAKYMVNQPLEEGEKLLSVVEDDVKLLQKNRKKLIAIRSKITGDPLDEQIAARFKAECDALSAKWHNLYRREHESATIKAEAAIAWEEFNNYRKAQNIQQEVIREKMREESRLNDSPLAEVYRCQLAETERLIESIDASLLALGIQQKDVEERVTPIRSLAEDLKDYLDIASDISTIRKAGSDLNAINIRTEDRKWALDVLAHHCTLALEGLSEVKDTLEAGRTARNELLSGAKAIDATPNQEELHVGT